MTRVPGTRSFAFRFLVLASILAVAACAAPGHQASTPTLTEDVPLAAPPPTIDDLLALLEQGPAPEWRERIAADRILADQPAPGGFARPQDGAVFYYRRGLAAQNVGRARQQLEDLGRAVDLGRDAGGVQLDFMISALGFSEQNVGRYSRHPALRQEALDHTAIPGARLVWNIALAEHHAALGDLGAAEAALTRAGAHQSGMEGGDSDWPRLDRAWHLYGRAAVVRAQGRPLEAEGYARQAIAELDVSGIRRSEFWGSNYDFEDAKRVRMRRAREELARTLLVLGRLQQAEIEGLKALRIAAVRYGRDYYETASSLLTVAEVILQQGRAVEGERVAREALAIFDRIGAAREAVGRARARRQVATALALRERWDDALTEFETIDRDMAPDPQSLACFFQGDLDWALTLVRTGQPRRAVDRLAPLAGPLEQRLGPGDAQVGELRGVLGLALAASGDRTGALREFRAALPVLLASSAGGSEGATLSLREQRLRTIADAYVSTLASVGGGNAVAEAFRVADAARGLTVQRAIGAGAARAAAKDPALAELVRQDQDAEKRLATLYRQLADLTVRPKDPKNKEDTRPAADTVRTQIDQLSRARADFVTNIARQFPAYADLTDPKPVTLARIPVVILLTGRPAALEVPIDITDAEMLELIGWMLTSMVPSLRALDKPGPAILGLDGRRLA